MTTLREQIDSLSPEQFAKDALMAARRAESMAKELGIELPERIVRLLEMPEEELARRRAKAIENELR